MTIETVALADLLAPRERMLLELQSRLNPAERKFLISTARNEPDGGQLDIPHLAELPAIRWKLRNLAQLAKSKPGKFEPQASALEKALS